MDKWFTSDYHLGHANIIKYCARKKYMSPKEIESYALVEQEMVPMSMMKIGEDTLRRMNEDIIESHNRRVSPDDTVFFLGDFCFRNTPGGKYGEGTIKKAEDWIAQLNGRFVFVQGNHDRNNSLSTPITRCVIRMGSRDICLCHDPVHCLDGFNLCFCGHVHEKWKHRRFMREDGSYYDAVNVGVDVRRYAPCSFNEIIGEYERWRKGNVTSE